MSVDFLGEQLATLVLSARGGGDGVRTMFGTVLTSGTAGVTLRPDSDETGTASMGPLQLVCGKATVAARVLCIYLPDNKVWVVIGK